MQFEVYLKIYEYIGFRLGTGDSGTDNSKPTKRSKIVRPDAEGYFEFFKAEIVKWKTEREDNYSILSEGDPIKYKAIKYGDIESYISLIKFHNKEAVTQGK